MEIGKFEELLISDDTLSFEVVWIYCIEFFPVQINLTRGEKVIFKELRWTTLLERKQQNKGIQKNISRRKGNMSKGRTGK